MTSSIFSRSQYPSFFLSSSGAFRLAFAAIVLTGLTPLHAAPVTAVTWTGAIDADYTKAGNWSSNAVPTSTSAVVLNAAAATRALNLAYTGVGNATYQIGAISTGANGAFSIKLSGTAAGRLIYNFTEKGTYAFNTDPNTNQGGGTNPNTRLWLGVTVGPYATLAMVGPNTLTGGTVAGMSLVRVNISSTGVVDGSAQTGSTTFQLGGVDSDVGGTVLIGTNSLSLGGAPTTAPGTVQTINGSILGNGTATTVHNHWGGGTTYMNGTVDVAGIWQVREGAYIVNGVHRSNALTVFGGSGQIRVLGGTGQVYGNVTLQNLGTITPAEIGTAGTLTINGNVTSSGVLGFDMETATKFDQLVVKAYTIPATPPSTPAVVANGDLTLVVPPSGPTTNSIAVRLAPTFPLQPGTYRLIKTEGNIFGSFGSVALPNSQGLASHIVMGPQWVDIVFEQLPFATNPLLSGNHLLIAQHIDNNANLGAVQGPLLDSLNRQPSIALFRQVLDQISPASYYGWYPSAVVRTNAMVQTVEDRLDQNKARKTGSWESYTQSYRQESSIDRNARADYTNFDTVSVLGGGDYALSSMATVGALIDYSNTHTDLDTIESNSTTDSYTCGLYAQGHRDGWQAQATGFFGWDKYTATRNISLTQIAPTVTSHTNGTRMGASVYAGHTTKFSWIEIMPNAGFQWLDWSADKFSEKGAGNGFLVMEKQNETSLAGRLGLRFAQSYNVKHGVIRPFINLTWLHEFNNGLRTIKATLFGDRLSVKARGIEENGMRFDAGLDWDMTQKLSLQVRYSLAQSGAADESLGVRAGLNFAF